MKRFFSPHRAVQGLALLLCTLLLCGCTLPSAPSSSASLIDLPVVSSAGESSSLQEAPSSEAAPAESSASETDSAAQSGPEAPDEAGSYTDAAQVALYLHLYGHLPGNFISKKEASALGWDNSKGNLADVAPGKSIGGDRFGNFEGLLPEADGRRWTECDIDYSGGYRGAKRIVFSNDGLIYYTEDHYETFTQLY